MFLATTLELATPLIIAALGCLLSDRAGVVNIAIEGTMLTGAFVGAVVSLSPAGPVAGTAAAMVAGLILGGLLAWTHLHLGADIFLAGIALNLIAAGGTTLGLFALTQSDTGVQGSLQSHPLTAVAIPGLARVPVLDNFAELSPITWIAIVLVPTLTWTYFNTKQGIWTRAVGDNAAAVIEAGISPRAVKWRALLASGALAGLAGSQLSLFTTSTFVQNMTQGAGFIALAAVYLGFRHPIGTTVAALVFGAFQALSTILQVRTNLPTDPLLALPYVVTVIALGVAGLRTIRRRGVRLL